MQRTAARTSLTIVRACRFNSSSSVVPAQSKTGLETTQDIKETVPVDGISGAPESLQGRVVRIYSPAKTNMQSGVNGTGYWKLDWDTLEKSNRWANPVMGWASSGDFMQGTHLKFRSQDEAVAFAEKQGWDYYVQQPHNEEFHPKSYSSNFTVKQMNPRKIAHTK